MCTLSTLAQCQIIDLIGNLAQQTSEPKKFCALQVMMLELLPATLAYGVEDACLRNLLPCLLAAMSHPAQDVRGAALPAAEALANVCSILTSMFSTVILIECVGIS